MQQLSREITQLTQNDAKQGISEPEVSWHAAFLSNAYVTVKNLDERLSEGDLIVLFSQFGEVVDCCLLRHHSTGKPLGVAFVAFEHVLSTILAIENMNGVDLLGRSITVDHAQRHVGPLPLAALPSAASNAGGKGRQQHDPFAALCSNLEARQQTVWDADAYQDDSHEDEVYAILVALHDAKRAGTAAISLSAAQVKTLQEYSDRLGDGKQLDLSSFGVSISQDDDGDDDNDDDDRSVQRAARRRDNGDHRRRNNDGGDFAHLGFQSDLFPSRRKASRGRDSGHHDNNDEDDAARILRLLQQRQAERTSNK